MTNEDPHIKRFKSLLKDIKPIAVALAESKLVASVKSATEMMSGPEVPSGPMMFGLAELGKTPNWKINNWEVELRSVFDESKLDPEDPNSWRTLVQFFAISFYGPKKAHAGGIESGAHVNYAVYW
jgi:hypothetical protein